MKLVGTVNVWKPEISEKKRRFGSAEQAVVGSSGDRVFGKALKSACLELRDGKALRFFCRVPRARRAGVRCGR